uniref:Uncharacterized protein n=1 Tax=Oryza sativa subsp. japonica TaxID=39947 RepID=Q7XIY0_ORYSJ|nr:hypothetical protein [Oryza sativa Japonica Group]BAD31917.1 hypothetical protein [Oryza sativa Japonica Group]
MAPCAGSLTAHGPVNSDLAPSPIPSLPHAFGHQQQPRPKAPFFLGYFNGTDMVPWIKAAWAANLLPRPLPPLGRRAKDGDHGFSTSAAPHGALGDGDGGCGGNEGQVGGDEASGNGDGKPRIWQWQFLDAVDPTAEWEEASGDIGKLRIWRQWCLDAVDPAMEGEEANGDGDGKPPIRWRQ